MRTLILSIGLCVALAGTVNAQFIVPLPPGAGLIHPPQQPGIQYLGTLPNGIRVINPWNMYNNFNNQPPFYYFNPYPVYPFNPYFYGFNNPYFAGPAAFVPNPILQAAVVQREAGRFVLVGNDLAVNPITGTRLAPNRGIAITAEGAFYRAPGTGSLTGYGAYIPGSGLFVNPFSGDLYQPSTGLIIRR